jgi:toxin CcdB
MARFRAYRVGDGDALALDVQANLLDSLHTRVLVPLVPLPDISRTAPRLNPRFEIDGKTFVMMTEFIAAVPLPDIGPQVADLSAQSDAILNALDFLFQGF